MESSEFHLETGRGSSNPPDRLACSSGSEHGSLCDMLTCDVWHVDMWCVDVWHVDVLTCWRVTRWCVTCWRVTCWRVYMLTWNSPGSVVFLRTLMLTCFLVGGSVGEFHPVMVCLLNSLVVRKKKHNNNTTTHLSNTQPLSLKHNIHNIQSLIAGFGLLFWKNKHFWKEIQKTCSYSYFFIRRSVSPRSLPSLTLPLPLFWKACTLLPPVVYSARQCHFILKSLTVEAPHSLPPSFSPSLVLYPP